MNNNSARIKLGLVYYCENLSMHINEHEKALQWAEHVLASNIVTHQIVVQTPWSVVYTRYRSFYRKVGRATEGAPVIAWQKQSML